MCNSIAVPAQASSLERDTLRASSSAGTLPPDVPTSAEPTPSPMIPVCCRRCGAVLARIRADLASPAGGELIAADSAADYLVGESYVSWLPDPCGQCVTELLEELEFNIGAGVDVLEAITATIRELPRDWRPGTLFDARRRLQDLGVEAGRIRARLVKRDRPLEPRPPVTDPPKCWCTAELLPPTTTRQVFCRNGHLQLDTEDARRMMAADVAAAARQVLERAFIGAAGEA